MLYYLLNRLVLLFAYGIQVHLYPVQSLLGPYSTTNVVPLDNHDISADEEVMLPALSAVGFGQGGASSMRMSSIAMSLVNLYL
jgi:hypothetical protein